MADFSSKRGAREEILILIGAGPAASYNRISSSSFWAMMSLSSTRKGETDSCRTVTERVSNVVIFIK